MNLLVIHQNFPGQFRHVVLEALRRRIKVLAIGRDTAPGVVGIELRQYRSSRIDSNIGHPYLRGYEVAVRDGQSVFELLKKLKREGYRPDIVLAHPGWGESLFVKDVYPNVPLIHFCEYYYRAQGADSGFDREFAGAWDASSRLRVLNSMHLLNIEQCDVGIAPTQWQRSLFPQAYQPKIRVIHEGVIQKLHAEKVEAVTLPNGVVIKTCQPIVTYVARNLEPYRGFHVFMRSISHIQAQCPTAQIVIVGGDDVSYGRRPVGFKNWRERMLSEVGCDTSKVHFAGRLPYQKYRAVLELSKVHVYLTYPFVLSWSLLEAMASNCVVIGSDTAPVTEVVVDGVNGFIVDFFDGEAIAAKVCGGLRCFKELDDLRNAAKRTASRFSIDNGLKGYFQIFEDAVAGRF
ncbi:glycosyltransferase [Pseudomonas koreensis]|uniref:glycosyltransferase family 4 protein n=1 Tax=Pseudomonas TaxID=286 RepID=UPI0005977D2B|nr:MULTISPECIES: glycosyltransferase family 4 protein [Pseudomonas]KIK86217.1 glycosyl transferase family 1 [Pseudomonas sp. W15Feb9B]NTZ97444.1 glycosyltransferase [Pseudomonas koreensis]